MANKWSNFPLNKELFTLRSFCLLIVKGRVRDKISPHWRSVEKMETKPASRQSASGLTPPVCAGRLKRDRGRLHSYEFWRTEGKSFQKKSRAHGGCTESKLKK